jgi:type I restriction enzyme S subunit
MKCDYEADGVPVLRIPNIQDGRVDHSDLKFGRLVARDREKLALDIGDLLMIRSNGSVSLVGRSAIATAREQGFAFAGYLIRVRLRLDLADPRFIQAVLETPELRTVIETTARSTSGVHNINSEEIKALPLVLPPLHEQRIIADRFEALDRTLAAVRTRVDGGANLSERLAQSILAKAFAGELVPTEAELARRHGRSYEPASVLLERVRGNSDGRRAGRQPRGSKDSAPVDEAPRQRRTRGD